MVLLHLTAVLILAPIGAAAMSSCSLFKKSNLWDGDVVFVWPTPKPGLDSGSAVDARDLADMVVKDSIRPPGPGEDVLLLNEDVIKDRKIPVPEGVRPGDRVVCRVHQEYSFASQGDAAPEATISKCRRDG
ncbi:hypothetical protein [Nocardia niigatensis]